MKILCYSQAGYEKALNLTKTLDGKIYYKKIKTFSSKEVLDQAFRDKDPLLFISATGIAVRLIAPFIKGKDQDPPVLVMDDQARFVISLLSGHLGGANALCKKVADLTGAYPVITTATDSRGYEGLDLYAKRMNLAYTRVQDLTPLTGAMVDHKTIYVYNPWGLALAKYPNFTQDPKVKTDYCLAITEKEVLDLGYKYVAYLRPQVLHLGLGCRNGADYTLLEAFLQDTFKKHGLSLKSVKDLGSIDIKANEAAFLTLKERMDRPFYVFTSQDLSPFEDQVQGSSFVKKTVGVSSVSGTAALKLGGHLLVDKERRDGFTLSISIDEKEK